MASTYVNDLRLNEMATGDASGTWGEVTNTNLELIAEAFSYGTEAITTNADTHTTTIADGATDPGRSMYLKYTGTLDSACTITIGPNTVSKLWFIENATSGSQNIIISQGSGANVTIPPGDVKVVYSDGAGSGAAVTDAFASLSVVDLKVQDDLTVTDDLIVNGDIDLEGNMDVNGSLETDALSLNGTTVTSTAAELNILDGVTSTAAEINLLDGSSANTVVNSKAVIYGSSGQVAGTLSTAAQGNITSLGTLTTLTVDDITINGSTISDSGDLTLDVGGDIILNADGGDWLFYDGSTTLGSIQNDGNNNLVLMSNTNDKDIKFLGIDNTSTITALTLDMSDAGTAIFNHNIKLPDSGQVIFGADSDLSIYHDNSAGNIVNNTGVLNITNNDIRFKTSGAETMLRAIANGAVKLMYNNSTKIETIDTGVTVTGAIGIGTTPTFGSGSGLEIERSGTCTIRLEDTSNKAAEIRMGDAFEIVSMNSGSDIVLDASNDIVLDADGGDILFKDGGTSIGSISMANTDITLTASVDDLILTAADNIHLICQGSDAGIDITGNAGVTLYYDGSSRLETTTGGAEISGGITPLVVRASNTTNTPLWGMYAQYRNTSDNGSGAGLSLGAETANGTEAEYVYVGAIIEDNTNSDQHGIFVVAPQDGGSRAERLRLTSAGNFTLTPRAGTATVINEAGIDSDFRVESNGVQYMLFVDGGNDRIGINQNSPQATLDVDGNVIFGSGNRFTTSANVFKSTASGENGVQLRSAVSTAGNPSFSNVDDQGTGMFLPGSQVVGFTAGSVEKLRISSFLVEPESGVNIGSIRNNGVTVGTSAVNVLDLGSVNSSGDLGKGRYLVTACATSGTVGTAGSAIYGLSTSGAVYLYETVNGNSVTFGSNGSQVTLSVASGSYSMHVNAIPLSVDN